MLLSIPEARPNNNANLHDVIRTYRSHPITGSPCCLSQIDTCKRGPPGFENLTHIMQLARKGPGMHARCAAVPILVPVLVNSDGPARILQHCAARDTTAICSPE